VAIVKGFAQMATRNFFEARDLLAVIFESHPAPEAHLHGIYPLLLELAVPLGQLSIDVLLLLQRYSELNYFVEL
jgi:hypothetical protein